MKQENEKTGGAIMPSEELHQLRIRNAYLEAQNEGLIKIITDYVAQSAHIPSILLVNDYPDTTKRSGVAMKFFSENYRSKNEQGK